ncbi:MAG: hypothetical protein CYPHOPRED_005564 [Cyphobasidiales sp. Tagirdzhanova-0007]|nr:MAG: hypothetical protein CYPHOPRED_005564 [Cyphobasidiales sp. Tagirdzhanova-0007]
MKLYTLSLVALLLLALLASWTYRYELANYLPVSIAARLHLRQYQAVNTFSEAIESGFTSHNFDVSQNAVDDTRMGLDEDSLTELRRIMDTNRVGFDEARLIRQQRIMRKNGIDPTTGLPLDAKAITSLS